jgi:GNAT superfamily N-acetyltransferase
MNPLSVRTARRGDEDMVLKLLYELAEYEKLTDKFRLTRDIIARDFVGDAPACFCEIAYAGTEPVGVMTWYRTYASFAASRGIFLEDLFVRVAHRGKGYGKALLAHLAKRAIADGAAHVEWFVLDWNTPSIEFYDRLRAEPVTGWRSYRLSGQALKNLAHS